MSLAGVTNSIGWQRGCLLGEGHFSPQQREVGFPFNLSEGRREITSHLQETRNNFWSPSIIFFLFVCLVSIYWHDIALKLTSTTMQPKCTTYIMCTIQRREYKRMHITYLAFGILCFPTVNWAITVFFSSLCHQTSSLPHLWQVHRICPQLVPIIVRETLIQVNESDSKVRQPV